MTTTWTTPDLAEESPAGSTPRWRPGRALLGLALVLVLLLAAGLYLAGRPNRPAMPPLLPAVTGPRLVAGVPVSYPHDEQGAQSAATNYVVAYGSAAMMVPESRKAILDAILDPERSPTLRPQLDAGLPIAGRQLGLDEHGQPMQPGVRHVQAAFPIGVRTLAYSPQSALIAVWASFLEGFAGVGSTRPVSEGWATLSVTVRWVAGDWKWATWSEQDGPVPVSGVQEPSDSQQIADATELFGGLTYAARN